MQKLYFNVQKIKSNYNKITKDKKMDDKGTPFINMYGNLTANSKIFLNLYFILKYFVIESKCVQISKNFLFFVQQLFRKYLKIIY